MSMSIQGEYVFFSNNILKSTLKQKGEKEYEKKKEVKLKKEEKQDNYKMTYPESLTSMDIWFAIPIHHTFEELVCAFAPHMCHSREPVHFLLRLSLYTTTCLSAH